MKRRWFFRTRLLALAAVVTMLGVAQPQRTIAVSSPPPHSTAATQPSAVSVPGDFNHLIGCSGDWLPDCPQAQLALRPDGVWWLTLNLPAGTYQYKAALNMSWTVSYGAHGGSANITLVVPTSGQAVTFFYDNTTHWITDNINSQILTAEGDFQAILGCPTDWAPDCLVSWLEDLDGDGTYTFITTSLPSGTYHVKTAVNLSSAITYGAGGVLNGPPISFTVSNSLSTTTFSFNSTTHVLTVTSVPLVQGPPARFGHPTARRGDVIANLWEWNWNSVAQECTTVLGPAGYGGVQVAPPEDSLSLSGHPWYDVYQPIDYSLNSRFGNATAFKAMVVACRAAGVKVYVDAVINHMTSGGGTSYGGVTATTYDYPGLYSSGDFHYYPADCPEPDDTIHDFNNYLEVTKCELLGLADLRTETNSVRAKIAGYLNKMIDLGVSGFRVDAAKHIGEPDLAAIESLLHNTLDGTRPYMALEVIPGGPGKLAPQAFEPEGSLLGFDFAGQIQSAFKSYTSPPGGNITALKIFGTRSGLLPSSKSLAFVENHDTERNGSTLNYKDGATNTLAHEFMLARGYATPEVYASFAWTDPNASPPADANGYVTNTDCNNGWACTDRSIGVANMVDWHNYAADAPVTNWYDDGINLIAFSRSNKAWIAMNNETSAQTKTFATGLPAGTYCDIIHGTYSVAHSRGSCSGPTVTVNGSGNATITVPAQDSVAFDAGDVIGPR